MWQHNYEPIAGNLGVSAHRGRAPDSGAVRHARHPRRRGCRRRQGWRLRPVVARDLRHAAGSRSSRRSTAPRSASSRSPGSCSRRSCCIGWPWTRASSRSSNIIAGLTSDRRLQAMFIAFCFGAFIEGAAGSVRRWRSRARCSPVSASTFLRGGHLSSREHSASRFRIDWHSRHDARGSDRALHALSAMVGTLCAIVSVFIPGYLIVVMAGWKRRSR